jgi:nitrogenase molybdenum-iron protein beta chain
MTDGLANSYALYKPKMIALCTTCMAEVIGDDLGSFIITSKQKGSVPEDFPVPFAHTPSFVGSHITGYDNMLKGILEALTHGKKADTDNGKINFIPGFDPYIGNIRELKRILSVMDVPYTVLADNAESFDSPNLGEFKMYNGGTTLEDAADSINAKATISFQKYSSPKSLEYLAEKGGQKTATYRPIGIRGTDEFLMQLSELTGKPIPQELEIERGRTVDAITDSQAWLHGKRVAIYGDPDHVLGLVNFVLELGMQPIHVVVNNGNVHGFEEEAKALLAADPNGQEGTVWVGKDLWHMRSLLDTEPVDLLIGNSYGKFLQRDTGTPLLRVGYPIFDRHHMHRYAILGYNGAFNLLNWIVNTILDELDRGSMELGVNDTSFDLVR